MPSYVIPCDKSRGKYEPQTHGEGCKGCIPSIHASVEGLPQMSIWGTVAPNAVSAQDMTKNTAPGYNTGLLLPPVHHCILHQVHEAGKETLESVQHEMKMKVKERD